MEEIAQLKHQIKYLEDVIVELQMRYNNHEKDTMKKLNLVADKHNEFVDRIIELSNRSDACTRKNVERIQLDLNLQLNAFIEVIFFLLFETKGKYSSGNASISYEQFISLMKRALEKKRKAS